LARLVGSVRPHRLALAAARERVDDAVDEHRDHRQDRDRDHDLDERHTAGDGARGPHRMTPPSAFPTPPDVVAVPVPPSPKTPASAIDAASPARDGFVTYCIKVKSRAIGPSCQRMVTVMRRIAASSSGLS